MIYLFHDWCQDVLTYLRQNQCLFKSVWFLPSWKSIKLLKPQFAVKHFAKTFKSNPANIYLLWVSKRSIGKLRETCSKLTIKSPERCHWCCFGVSIVTNFTLFSSVLFFWLSTGKFLLEIKFPTYPLISLTVSICSILYTSLLCLMITVWLDRLSLG